MQAKEAYEAAKALLKEGEVATWDEAVHMLYDMGEIDSNDHADMLTKKESKRIYG